MNGKVNSSRIEISKRRGIIRVYMKLSIRLEMNIY